MHTRFISVPILAMGLSMSSSAYQQPSYPVPSNSTPNTPVVNSTYTPPTKKAKHVFTNDDFPHSEVKPDTSKAVDPSKPATGDATTPPTSDPKSADSNVGKNVDANAVQIDALKAKSAEQQKSMDTLQSQLGRLENELKSTNISDAKRTRLEDLRSSMQQKFHDIQDQKNQTDQDLAAAQKNKDQKPADKPAPPPKS